MKRGGKTMAVFAGGGRRTWRPVRRRQRPGRAGTVRLLFHLATAVAAAVLVVRMVAGSAMFRMMDMGAVVVSGNRMVDRTEIVERSGLAPGMSILAIDPAAVAARVASHPWVASADVSRRLPAGVVIAVHERKPVALLARARGLAYVDAGGEVFAAAGPGDDLDYPVITGLERAGRKGWRAGLARAVAFVRSVDRDDPVFPRQILSEVHVGPDGELTMFLSGNPFPVRIGHGRKAARRFAAVLKHLGRRDLLGVTRFVDLDYGGGVLVRLALPLV